MMARCSVRERENESSSDLPGRPLPHSSSCFPREERVWGRGGRGSKLGKCCCSLARKTGSSNHCVLADHKLSRDKTKPAQLTLLPSCTALQKAVEICVSATVLRSRSSTGTFVNGSENSKRHASRCDVSVHHVVPRQEPDDPDADPVHRVLAVSDQAVTWVNALFAFRIHRR